MSLDGIQSTFNPSIANCHPSRAISLPQVARLVKKSCGRAPLYVGIDSLEDLPQREGAHWLFDWNPIISSPRTSTFFLPPSIVRHLNLKKYIREESGGGGVGIDRLRQRCAKCAAARSLEEKGRRRTKRRG